MIILNVPTIDLQRVRIRLIEPVSMVVLLRLQEVVVALLQEYRRVCPDHRPLLVAVVGPQEQVLAGQEQVPLPEDNL